MNQSCVIDPPAFLVEAKRARVGFKFFSIFALFDSSLVHAQFLVQIYTSIEFFKEKNMSTFQQNSPLIFNKMLVILKFHLSL